MAERKVGQAAVAQPWLPSLWQKVRVVPGEAEDVATAVALRALVGSRLVVWLAGLGAMALFGRNLETVAISDPNRLTAPFHAGWANFIFAPAARWDSVWYLQIAHSGYFARPSSAFFPLYPLLIHLGATVFGSEAIVGALISLVALLVGLYLLYLLARLDLSDRAARTTVLLVAFFPTAFFFSAIYTESLFLMLSVGAIYAARLDRWALASVFAALGSASRVNGVLVALPLILMFLYGPRRSSADRVSADWWRPRYRVSRSSLWLLLVPVGLVAYLGYLLVTHDAPWAPFQVQQQFWRHEFVGPFRAVVTLVERLPQDVHRLLTGHAIAFGQGDPLSWTDRDLIDVGFLIFAFAGLVLSWRRVPFAYFVYGFVYLAYSLSDPTQTEALQGFCRYLLLGFPLFMGWGAWLAEHRRARATALTISTALLVVFSGLWGIWAWIG